MSCVPSKVFLAERSTGMQGSYFLPRILIFAAMDTTSNALSRTLSVLASHPGVQEKLRQEILDAVEKNGGRDLSYDELVSLPFLDAVCRETLRLSVHCLFLEFSSLIYITPTQQLPTSFATSSNVCIRWNIHATKLNQDHNFRARKDAVLPLLSPITGVDGREMNEIVVPKDTTIIVSIINCNRDPALWGPDSYEWKPERWLSPLPDAIMEAPVPGIYSHL
jgi:Cytochrome P450